MNKYKTYGKGWYGESFRHSLAAKGMKSRQRLSFQPVDFDREKKIKEFMEAERNSIPEHRSKLTDFPEGSWQREAKARFLKEIEGSKLPRPVGGPSSQRVETRIIGGKELYDETTGITQSIHTLESKNIPKKDVLQYYDGEIQRLIQMKRDPREETNLREKMVAQGKRLMSEAKKQDIIERLTKSNLERKRKAKEEEIDSTGSSKKSDFLNQKEQTLIKEAAEAKSNLSTEEQKEVMKDVDDKINAAKVVKQDTVKDVAAMKSYVNDIDVESPLFDKQYNAAKAKIDLVIKQRRGVIPGQGIVEVRNLLKDTVEKRRIWLRGRPEEFFPLDKK